MTASEGIKYISAIDLLVYQIGVNGPQMGPVLHFRPFRDGPATTGRQVRYGPLRRLSDS